MELGTLDTDNITGTVTLTSIGGGDNRIGTLTSSSGASIEIRGETEPGTTQELTITTVGADVTSIDANGFTAKFTVSGVAAGSGDTATALSITGGNGTNDLTGGDGDDTLTGGADVDTLKGGAGDDTINGGEGDDTINGGDGNDTINGGDGNDKITGGAGKDDITGGAGADIFVFSSGDTGFSAANQIDEILDFSLEDKIEATDQSVADITVPAGTLENGIYTFGDQNNPGDNLDIAIGEIKILFGTTADIAVVFELENQHQYYYASFNQNDSSDDVLIDLGNISITSMADDGAGVFTFA